MLTTENTSLYSLTHTDRAFIQVSYPGNHERKAPINKAVIR